MKLKRLVIAVFCLALVAAACSDSDLDVAKPDDSGDGADTDTDGTDESDDSTDLGHPDCRASEPIGGDWCEISGAVPEGGSVRITGPLVPIDVHPEEGDYAVQVPLGFGSTVEIAVETFDVDGESFDQETISVARSTEEGDQIVSGVVTEYVGDGTAGEPIAGAEVTVAGRTMTTNENGFFQFGEYRTDGDEYVVDDAGDLIVDDGLSPDADLVHIGADGYIGRLDSFTVHRLSPFDENVHLRIDLQPLAEPVTVKAGAAAVALNDHVRIEFGPDGAPSGGTISLTDAPITGTALEPFGVPLFDLSPFELGPGSAIHIALEPEGESGGGDKPAEVTLWEPNTATRRIVAAHIDEEADELVIPVDTLVGEALWFSPSEGIVIRRVVLDTSTVAVEGEAYDWNRLCGDDVNAPHTVHATTEWDPDAEAEPPAVGRLGGRMLRSGLFGRFPFRGTIRLEHEIPAGEVLDRPPVVAQTRQTVRYEIRFDPGRVTDAERRILGFEHSLLPLSLDFTRTEMTAAVLAEGVDADGNPQPPISLPVGDERPATDCDIEGRWLAIAGSPWFEVSDFVFDIPDAIEITRQGRTESAFAVAAGCGSFNMRLTTFAETFNQVWLEGYETVALTCSGEPEDGRAYAGTLQATWEMDWHGDLWRNASWVSVECCWEPGAPAADTTHWIRDDE